MSVTEDCAAFCRDLEDGGMYRAAAFVRSLERIRVAADAYWWACWRDDSKDDAGNEGRGARIGITQNALAAALDAHRREFGS
jgi:hypothetical protein